MVCRGRPAPRSRTYSASILTGALHAWEADQPVPPPVLASEMHDPRLLREIATLQGGDPYAGKHIQDAGGPVEDFAVLRLNFGSQDLGWPIYSYVENWRNRSMASTFSYQRRVLRFLQAPGGHPTGGCSNRPGTPITSMT